MLHAKSNVAIVAAMAALLVTASASRADDAGQKPASIGDAIENGAKNTGAAIEKGANDIGATLQQQTAPIGNSVKQEAQETGNSLDHATKDFRTGGREIFQ